MKCEGIGKYQDQGCPAHYAAEDYMRDKFEQLVRDTCHVDEYTFKRDGGAYFRTTYAKTHDGLPPREMASVQTLWTFYQAGAAHQRAQQPQSAEVGICPGCNGTGEGVDMGDCAQIACMCSGTGRITAPQPSAGVVMPDWKGLSERLMDFITHAEVSSGVCCCGDYMQGHADPMASGHSPVDMWDNAVLEFGREFARLNGKEVGRG